MKQVIVMAMIGVALFLGGCSDLLKEPARTDTGLVQVSFHIGPVGPARTALPALPDIHTYKVEFSRDGESPISKTITETSLTERLVPGDYTIKVTGYDASGIALAEGATTASITENATTTVAVQLDTITLQNGEGTFSYTVNLPMSLEKGTLWLTALAEGTNTKEIDLSVNLSGSLKIPSGYYQVSLRLTAEGKTARKIQIAHIYDNLETAAVYDFTADDFTAAYAGYAGYAGNSVEFADILTDIRESAETDFIIYITSGFDLDPVQLADTGYRGKTITICGEGGVRELTLSSKGALFTVGSSSVGPTLVLQDISLRGRSDNSSSLVVVNGGALVLDSGGTISGNSSSSSYSGGGGVSVSGGTFTMEGGTISGNSSSYAGGGVYVGSGTFTMEGGTISGNSSYYSYGGGVYVHSYGTFTKAPASGSTTSGIIYGSDATDTLKNTAGNGGAAVYYDSGSSKKRNTTVYERISLSTGSNENWNDPAALTADIWSNRNITSSTQIDTYSIAVTGGTTYRVWWNDSDEGNSIKTGDVQVSAEYSNGTSIFGWTDSGWSAAQPFTANTTGTVLVRVQAYNGGATGTYGIVYSTGSARPGDSGGYNNTLTALTADIWSNGNIPSSAQIDDIYSIAVTGGTTYRVWWNDSYAGNGGKTLDVKVSAEYSNGTSIFGWTDSGWTTAQSFTANTTGTVLVRVQAYSSGATGTYGIVYSVGSTRP